MEHSKALFEKKEDLEEIVILITKLMIENSLFAQQQDHLSNTISNLIETYKQKLIPYVPQIVQAFHVGLLHYRDRSLIGNFFFL